MNLKYFVSCLKVGNEGRELLFLFERGKKEFMDGTRVIFKGG